MAYCPECGKNIGDVGFCPDCDIKNENSLNKKNEGLLLDIRSAWLAIALILPIIGLIAGIVFAVQNKRGGLRLIGFSLVWMTILVVASSIIAIASIP